MHGLSNGTAVKRAAILAAALTVLNASLTFVNVWPTPLIRWNGSLSAELALVVLIGALASGRGWIASRRFLGVAAGIWVLLVIGRYADVTVQSLFGREINLYWDSRHFSAVGAMLTAVANPLIVVGAVAALVGVPLLLFLPLRWALGRVAGEMTHAPARRALMALSLIVLALAGVQHREEPFTELPQFASMVTPIYAHQARLLAVELSGAGRKALPPPPTIDSDFSRVNGADVFVLFLESYGATSWDRPEYVKGLVPARERFAAAIAGSGRHVVSAYAQSPTFGGSSWLAHVSLLSGVEVRDGDTNMRLMAQTGRPTLVTAFKRHGYHTVAVMPGLRQRWPEGEFYGFDDILGETALDYHGPPFGWWDVTDQFAIAKMDELAVAKLPRPPVFVFLPTISTHTPFLPTPPYQPDWTRILGTHPYDDDVRDAAWDDTPDWLDLGPGYVKALTYSFDTIGGYLRLRHDRDFVVILLGDHQPPSVVSGEGASWEVPVHVIASRPQLLDALKARGFKDGLEPAHPAISTIDGLLNVLVTSFGDKYTD
jgi:hypothetical protein